jgi:hypothetical protein
VKRRTIPCVGFLALALAVAVTAAWVAPAAAVGKPLTVAEFSARIDRASAAVSAAGSRVASGTVAADLADTVDALLPLDMEVVEGTATIAVADDTMVRELTSRLRDATSPGARRAVLRDLASHLASMRAAVGVAGSNPADPAALREILAGRPVTTGSGSDWLGKQIEKVLQWIADRLSALNPPGTGAHPFAPSRLVTGAIIAVPVLLVVWVLLRARRRRRGSTSEPGAVAGLASHGPVVDAAADLPADPLAFAELLASDGRYRDAVRALYGGAARHLADEGVVIRMRTRTNQEMLRDVEVGSPALAPAFGRLTSDFEAAWYGHADPGGNGFSRARVSYESVVDAPDAMAPHGEAEDGVDA